MKEIIKKWCKSKNITIEEANLLLIEYYSIEGKSVNSQQLQMIIELGKQIPINWSDIISKICIKNNWCLIEVYSKPDQHNMTRIIYQYLAE